jgi:DNA segregation ATPase FtsK/SpoIIIE-like protein
MKTSIALAIALFAIVGAFAAADFSDDTEFVQYGEDNGHGDEAMVDALSEMRSHAPMHLKFHVSRINKHAMLLQKAKAYGHDFSASSKAIKAALAALLSQLNAGHKHDKAALAAAHKNSKAAISTTESNGKTKCVEYKNKACPTKRIEGEAKAKMDAAHTRMRNIGKSKACDSLAHGTWGGMDVDKANPKFGTVVRNAWDKKRGEYVVAHTKWMAEKKVFETAQKAHTEAMAAFTTAVNLEASNAHNACKNAHKQYNDLKNEVFNNVKSRKHVYIASLIIHCYVDNLKSNSAAKSCADKKRKSDTSMWNISANNLAACVSKAALQERFGPLSWKPSNKSCELKHWNERAHKEMQTKEKNTKESNAKEIEAKEKAKKEKNTKESNAKREAAEKEKVTKEVNAKEKAAKAKLERDTKAAKEKKEKEDERKLKERNTKEAQMKENNSKEKSLKKEKSDKEKATKESQAKEKVKKEKDAKEKAAKEKAAKKKEASNKESSKKEKDSKERATKKERSDKEKVSKEKLEKEKAREEKKNKAIEKDKKEKTSKEKAEKEKAAKAAAIAKEKDDKARERKSKDDERNAKKKEQQSKEATAKSNERNDKAAAAERKKKADEKEQKRRAAGTCTVTAYEHNSYRGRVEQRHSICHRGRYDIRYGTYGRRRGFQASSFKLSSGCQQVQLWDEDACRYGYGDNDNIHHSVSSVKYDLNDDICGISIWSKC